MKYVLLLFITVSCVQSLLHIPSTGRNHVLTKKPLIFCTSLKSSDIESLQLPKFIQESNKITVELVKGLLSVLYGKRHYARFAALETIARVPYFSYTSVLHLYETLGWFRKKEYIKIHFAESWNELHHLLIMEELGGNKEFLDKFIAQHIAFFYYWIVVALYITSPAVAYDLNKHVEQHAFQTYDEFIQLNEENLKSLPAPQIAIDYYQEGDLHMFDAFQYDELRQTIDSNGSQPVSIRRRPIIQTLYDVFYNIRADEADHANSMELLSQDVQLRGRSWTNLNENK